MAVNNEHGYDAIYKNTETRVLAIEKEPFITSPSELSLIYHKITDFQDVTTITGWQDTGFVYTLPLNIEEVGEYIFYFKHVSKEKPLAVKRILVVEETQYENITKELKLLKMLSV